MADDTHVSKADYIITQLNVSTAKKFGLFVGFLFILYHSIIHWKYGKLIIFNLNMLFNELICIRK